MRIFSSLFATVKNVLYRWRWGITALLAVVFLSTELFEHWPDAFKVSALIDILIKGLAFPLLFGFVLSLLSTKEQLSHVVNQLDMRNVVKRQLEDAQDWDELVTILLQIPRMILPLTGDSLIVLDLETSQYKLASEWSVYGSHRAYPTSDLPDAGCMAKLLSRETTSTEIFPCACSQKGQAAENSRQYCLPLYNGKRPVALLHLEISQGLSVQSDRLDLLTGVAPDMALAIDRFQIGRLITSQSHHYLEERQRLARYLHDTLAHNLAYLRLKIEQLSGDSSYRVVEDLRQDLRRLLPIANQSYEQVRSSLRELQETSQANLSTAIQEYAENIGQRTQLSIEVFQRGTARPLPPHVSRQVLYILREALSNVEKHADAHRVVVNMNWAEDGLIVETVDDGRGFNPKTPRNHKDSYGLQILQECAAELNGRLAISSEPGSGTQVQLWVPF